MVSIRIAGAVLLLTLLAACTAPRTQRPNVESDLAAEEALKQREIVIRQELADYERLYRVGYDLLEGGVSLCGERLKPAVGMQVVNSQSYPPEYRTAAEQVLGADDRLRIVDVVEGFPAAEAGLQEGDLLVALNGEPAPRGETAAQDWSESMAGLMASDEAVAMTVLRDGAERTLRVKPRMICDYPVHLLQNETMNAYADGEAIYVGKGMLRFAAADQELALIVAHELAHNAMGHIDAKKSNQLAGGLGGLLLDVLAGLSGANTGGAFTRAAAQSGAASYSVAFEQEADYVGLYVMAIAGMEIEGAAHFWRRMATVSPISIEMRQTHPTTPERFLAIEQTVAEIRAKQTGGLPLVPEMKSATAER